MAFQGYPENKTYESITNTAMNLGNTVSAAKKSRPVTKQPIPPQYPNVAGAVKDSGAAPSGVLPTELSSLGTMTTPYGGSTRYEKFHPAIDLAAPTGTAIPSLTGGTVTEAKNSPAFGNTVVVQDSEGNYLRYSHLNKDWVEVGDSVTKGQQIGEMGATGNVYSTSGGDPSHLDLRIYNSAKQYFNPSEYNYQ